MDTIKELTQLVNTNYSRHEASGNPFVPAWVAGRLLQAVSERDTKIEQLMHDYVDRRHPDDG